jgi:hypothetical protein
MTWGWANGNLNNRTTSDDTWRSRGYITADSRNQSEYGTIRSYIAVGINTSSTGVDNPSNTFSSNRAFIQFAGFTFGLSQSFFDFYSVPATSFWGSFPGSDTGDPGWQVAAYTAEFGGGLSASISAEMRRMTTIYRGIYAGNQAAALYGGFQAPDVVANMRLNQAWGSAQIMGALHQVNATYYVGSLNHPDDVWGFAVGAGLKFFVPAIGMGDYLQAQITYTNGASRYASQTTNSNWSSQTDVNTAGFGALTDAVYGTTAALGSTLELTTAWTLNAAYEHYWSKQWKTSLYGGYMAVSYNDSANNLLCTGASTVPFPNCDMNWSTFWMGSRTQWNITPDTYLGLDVMYSKLYSAQWDLLGAGGAARSVTNAGAILLATDPDNWQFRFRVHKDFYP